MSRAERLLALIQLLRRHRLPVAGRSLAIALGISLRTLYRDIASLQAQGAHIEGEAGIGYVLRPGFMLPPLMFSEDEIEALVLGSRWVAQQGDPRLAAAARDALVRIAAVLPPDLRQTAETTTLMVPQSDREAAEGPVLAALRQAIRRERKLAIRYRAADAAETQRVVWPIALGYFARARVLVGWCEARQGFRHFRADRIIDLTPSSIRYPQRRTALLAQWRAQEGIGAGDC